MFQNLFCGFVTLNSTLHMEVKSVCVLRPKKNILIIGAGQLGRLVADEWKSLHPKSKVTLKFRSHNLERQQALEREGFSVISQEKGETCTAPLIVFCAPPTGNPDYVQDIRTALEQNWNAGSKEAAFVFTSSGSVFAENDGGEVDETSEVVRTVRSEKLVDGEEAVLGHGGCVLRLGGLYPYSRETMQFYSKKGSQIARPRGIINQVRELLKTEEKNSKNGGLRRLPVYLF